MASNTSNAVGSQDHDDNLTNVQIARALLDAAEKPDPDDVPSDVPMTFWENQKLGLLDSWDEQNARRKNPLVRPVIAEEGEDGDGDVTMTDAAPLAAPTTTAAASHPAVTTNLGPFVVGVPEDDRLTLTLLDTKSGSYRSYTWAHQPVHWNSQAEITALNKWKSSKITQCMGAQNTPRLAWSAAETDFLESLFRANPSLKLNDAHVAFNNHFLNDATANGGNGRSKNAVRSAIERNETIQGLRQ
ncbi:hypothetical protein BJ546DRAFT_449377 [Cryomyces antarcticus]|uniref:Uncharacterized protein n=1 Tax=Cryomyces antarcticus TaxID=329879 RepID=A0ABR0KUT5_9PEZI|nr:hypothetical protein LTR39_000245 [Cryomyces antarcticus]KAK5020977.1 hypothetical protein LTR60_000173 [Cryomyces antarcticus]KAK5131975.1 hypothetical protein LTR16_000196 [Cryomyces antarcticus]